MANIFGGTEPPAWLQAAAHPINTELTGRVLGLGLGATLNALQRDTSPSVPADASWLQSRKGFKEGLFEARMNLTDPMWKMKEAGLQAQIAGQQAQTAHQTAMAQTAAQELKWQAEDSPKVAAWLAASPERRKTMDTPTAHSDKFLNMIRATRDADERSDMLRSIAKEKADLQAGILKQRIDEAKFQNEERARQFKEKMEAAKALREQNLAEFKAKEERLKTEAQEKIDVQKKTAEERAITAKKDRQTRQAAVIQRQIASAQSELEKIKKSGVYMTAKSQIEANAKLKHPVKIPASVQSDYDSVKRVEDQIEQLNQQMNDLMTDKDDEYIPGSKNPVPSPAAASPLSYDAYKNWKANAK